MKNDILSVGQLSQVTDTHQFFLETRCIQLYGIQTMEDGGRLPQNVARMQGVTSQIILFASNGGTTKNITEKRAEITLQSAFGHVMEPVHRLGSCAMCNACGIMTGNRPSDSANYHC